MKADVALARSGKPRLFERLGARSLREAKRGNLQPLMGRLLGKEPLTDGEREFLAQFLDKHDGWRGRELLRRIEWGLMRMRFERLRTEGEKYEAAIRKIMAERNVKRSTVCKAIKTKLERLMDAPD